MNGSRKSDAAAEGKDGQEYGLALKAIDIVEIARCRPRAEAEGLVLDVLKDLVRSIPPRARARRVSGCMAAAGSCPTCADYTRLFAKPDGALVCGACMMDELLSFMHEC